MSGLIEKLKVASGAESQPMGFSPRQSAGGKPRLQLVAGLSSAEADRLPDLSAADAGIVSISDMAGLKTLEKLCKTVDKIPWGGWLKDVASEVVARIAKSGCDYIISPVATPVSVFRDEKFGRILEVDTSLNEGLLRTIESLPVDAVLLAGETEGFLTMHHLMLYRRLVGLAGKPVLASVPSGVTADELQALWEVGVCGVIVVMEGKQAGDRLNDLRKEVEKMPLPSNRKRARGLALLPRLSVETPPPTEEEEEPEEE